MYFETYGSTKHSRYIIVRGDHQKGRQSRKVVEGPLWGPLRLAIWPVELNWLRRRRQIPGVVLYDRNFDERGEFFFST